MYISDISTSILKSLYTVESVIKKYSLEPLEGNVDPVYYE